MMATCLCCKVSEVGCVFSNYHAVDVANFHCFCHAAMPVFVCAWSICDVVGSQKVEKKRKKEKDCR